MVDGIFSWVSVLFLVPRATDSMGLSSVLYERSFAVYDDDLAGEKW